MTGTLDDRDVFYTLVGLALLGLTMQPALARFRWINFPLVYVAIGAGLSAIGLPMLDPRGDELTARVIEHIAELIVIISLAGAGLAIDARLGWTNARGTVRLLLIAMPITILALALLGIGVLGLSVAGATLLAAAMAPTDPVLARSVQVGGPGEDETPLQISLTAEAGLNDGLAFPFVYLAIAMATYGVGAGVWQEWIWGWLTFDMLYRVAAGLAVGYGIGIVLGRFSTSPLGDAQQGGSNAVLMVLGATMASYGLTEAIDGYGFLAVFMAARAGRAHTRQTDMESYDRFVHQGADQLESILLALMLLWLGMFAAGGALETLTWRDWVVALALIFLVRPLGGLIALAGVRCGNLARGKVAFFGIRGMGSVFYIAYAQNHADFSAEIERIWCVAILTILISIVIHGFGANFTLDETATAKSAD